MTHQQTSNNNLLQKLSVTEQKDILEIYNTLSQHNFECYLVGGCVRDLLLDKHGDGDIDLTTNAHPETIIKLFKHTVPTGIKHGTITILFQKRPYEITTYRTESIYSDGRRPDQVQYAKTLKDDLSRRDFSMNALCLHPMTGELIDYHQGQLDIKNKLIRTIGHPEDRFLEDGLRPIRACRFTASLGFKLAQNIKDSFKQTSIQKRISQIAIERFSDELWKGLRSKNPGPMISSLEENELIFLFIKYPATTQKTSKNCLDGLQNQQEAAPEFKMALWWIDIGIIGRPEIQGIAKKLKFSNLQINKIFNYQLLILFQQGIALEKLIPSIESNLSKLHQTRIILSKIKKNLSQEPNFLSLTGKLGIQKISIAELQQIWHYSPLVITDLKITGKDLIEQGLQGRQIGDALEAALVKVLAEPDLNTHTKLLEWVKNL